MKRLMILAILGIVVPREILCQNKARLDSLMKAYRGSDEDTLKVNVLLSISDLYETNNQDSSFFYLEKVKPLAEKIGFQNGLYKYYEKSAILYFTIGNYRNAMNQSTTALRIAQELGNENFISTMLNNTGIVYQYLGEFENQLDFSLQAMTRIEQRSETRKLSASYHSVANAYYNLKRYRKSIDYCLQGIRAHEQYGGSKYVNRIFATLGQNYEYLSQYDSALFYYEQAKLKSVEADDRYAEAAIYDYMANLYASVNDFVAMLDASKNSLRLSKELQSRQMLASSLSTIALAYFYNNDQEKAESHIYDALKIAASDSLQDVLKNIYTVLSYISAKDGDYKTSLWAKSKSDSIQAALVNTEVVNATTELEAKYESDKRNTKIRLQQTELKQKDIMNNILIGSLAAILIVGLLAYRNYKHQRKLQHQRISELETEKQLSATEAVLKGEEQERTRLAKDLHDGLGGMLSGIKYSFNTMKRNLIMTPENHQAFERSMDMLDSSIKEMRRVAHNMMPESLIRFGLDTALRDFCSDITQGGALNITYQSINMEGTKLDQTSSITIYRIVQELIHNTIKHSGASEAIVQITRTDEKLAVTVEDNGVGFDTSILQKSTGAGWINIQSRVDFLKGVLEVRSDKTNGTSVHIDLKV